MTQNLYFFFYEWYMQVLNHNSTRRRKKNMKNDRTDCSFFLNNTNVRNIIHFIDLLDLFPVRNNDIVTFLW